MIHKEDDKWVERYNSTKSTPKPFNPDDLICPVGCNKPRYKENLAELEKELAALQGKYRETMLLVREYFQQQSRINFPKDGLDVWQAKNKANVLEKRILSELEAFTEQEQQELPFKETEI